jgi:hypothetical protein
MVTSNDIRCNTAASTLLLVVCIALKYSHTQNMLLRIELTGRYTHYKHVIVVYYYIEKES